MVRTGKRTGQGGNLTLPGYSEGAGGSFPMMTGAVSSSMMVSALLCRMGAAVWGSDKKGRFSHEKMERKSTSK